MRTSLTVALVVVAAACATTYNMPQEERSRSYVAPNEVVWEAALGALDDVGIAVIQAEEEHGQILARSKGNVLYRKGHVVRIVLSDAGNGRIRVDANAETVSDDSLVDFGRAHGIVRDYLDALDERLAESRGAPR